MKLLCNTLIEHDKTTLNFVNESHLFTQGKTIARTYTTKAREPYIYVPKILLLLIVLLATFGLIFSVS